MRAVDGQQFLTAPRVRRRYGGVSEMWLHRRLTDSDSDFPQPIYMGRLRMWRIADLEAYERRCAERKLPPPAFTPKRRARSSK